MTMHHTALDRILLKDFYSRTTDEHKVLLHYRCKQYNTHYQESYDPRVIKTGERNDTQIKETYEYLIDQGEDVFANKVIDTYATKLEPWHNSRLFNRT